MKKIFVLLITTFLASCSSTHTQTGLDLTDSNNFVTISTQTEKNNRILSGLDQRVVITSHNGQSLFRLGWDFTYPDVLHVASGVHTLEVQYNHMNSYANGCLWVDAILGENYIVKKSVSSYSVLFWIENVETNERVGGICGSQPTNEGA